MRWVMSMIGPIGMGNCPINILSSGTRLGVSPKMSASPQIQCLTKLKCYSSKSTETDIFWAILRLSSMG